MPFVDAHGLSDRLVGEGAGFGNDANAALGVNMAGHDADFSAAVVAGGDDAGAVRTNQSNTRTVVDERHGFHHVKCRNAFGDADHNAFALDGIKGVSSLHDGLPGEGRRDVDDGGIRIGGFDGFKHRVPHWKGLTLKVDGLTAFSGCASADDVGAVLDHLVSVEHSLLSSDALHEDLCVFFNPNRHQAPPPMSSTIFCAPSARSSAG